MPFFRSARFELVGATGAGSRRALGRPHVPLASHPSTWPTSTPPIATIRFPSRAATSCCSTPASEGGGDWSGIFVGTSFIFSHRAVLDTLEGDPRFFFDDSQTPQAQGTGHRGVGRRGRLLGRTQDDVALRRPSRRGAEAGRGENPDDQVESAYRFLLSDLLPFGKNARICLEHGGTNESTEHYETVTYWYGRPGATLFRTDSLQIGDAASEEAHSYASPAASAPYAITSPYEWGVDQSSARARSTLHTPIAGGRRGGRRSFACVSTRGTWG